MIEVEDMQDIEIEEVLSQVRYGHLACVQDDRPYIVPIHYAYDRPDIYIYTTEGLKTEIIRANPHVCLQVEQIVDNDDWRSVIVNGDAEEITDPKEREKIVKLIRSTNPALTPAISIRWIDNWIRENVEVVYRVKPYMKTGRSTMKVMINAAIAKS
ncbi:MAG: pyridoxamine 5'-phosphate oxidase family protein [Pyrinomonadaceae bacterium]